MSIRYTILLFGNLPTSDLHDEVLFIKAYSLKRNTILGGAQAKPDEEMIAGDLAGETKTTRVMQRDEANVKTDISEA